MNPKKIRRKNLRVVKRLGYSTNKQLPLLDLFEQHYRSLKEVSDRLLCLYIIVACSYGFSKKKGAALLREHGLLGSMTPVESAFLNADTDDLEYSLLQRRVESLCALAWCVHMHDDLDFSKACSKNFVTLFPDLKLADPRLPEFQETLSLRSPVEILISADLAYCIHWSVRDAQLRGQPESGKVPAMVIVERRRALEWVMSDQAWDDVYMDT